MSEHVAVASTLAQLKACIGQRDLAKGKEAHSVAAAEGHVANIFVASSLIDMYCKCGCMKLAQEVFDSMHFHDVVTWTSLVSGYAENGEGQKALNLFYEMQAQRCEPNAVTFVAALKACSSLAENEEVAPKHTVKVCALEKGMVLHRDFIGDVCDSNVRLATTLLEMYAKCGSMGDARKVFDSSIVHQRNVIIWNVLILGYADNGEGEEALDLFYQMPCCPDTFTFVAALRACIVLAGSEKAKTVSGKPVKIGSLEKGVSIHRMAVDNKCVRETKVGNTLVDMYAKCGCMLHARRVFDGMLSHSLVSWNALIVGYAENGQATEVLDMFYQMPAQGFRPDFVTFLAALNACGMLGALECGRAVHHEVHRNLFQDNPVMAVALIHFYGKCWSMEEAKRIFDHLADKNLVAWTALLSGYSRQGDVDQVLDLFRRMESQQIQPDGVTFLCILTACSHAGLIDQGKHYFESMTSKYGIEPSIGHYTCMADMLGRANRLPDAVKLVSGMPIMPDAVTWRTVLSACWKWKDVEFGRLAFESLLRISDEDATAYVLMAEIYKSHGMFKEQMDVEGCRQARHMTFA